MPVPTDINSLSPTASTNSPQGTETVGPIMNQYIQAAYSFIAYLNQKLVLPLSVANGGTGATDQATAQAALGLGNLATQNAGSVTGPFVMTAGQMVPTPNDMVMAAVAPATFGLHITSKTSGVTADTVLAGINFEVPGKYGIGLGLRGDGFFGVGGWSSPAWRWYTDPTGNMVSVGNITSNSDRKFKKRIKPIRNALATLMRLRGVTFERRKNNSGLRHMGFIAQEVQPHVPEVVGVGKDGELTLAYGNMTALLVEAVKELSREVERLKEKVGEK